MPRSVAALTLVAGLLIALVAASPASAAIPRHGITFGFWTDRNAAMPLVDDLGANTYRDWLWWYDFEGPGHPRFAYNQAPTTGSCTGWSACTQHLTALDNRVADAHARGITPLFFVFQTPAGWEMPECSSDVGSNPGSICPPADPNSYGAFVYNLARRYADRGTPIAIEVWNEADAKEWFHAFPNSPMPSYCASTTVYRSACEYSRLVKSAKFILAANGYADTTLVVGALAHVWYDWAHASEWINDLARNGALQIGSALSYHYYAPTSDNPAAVNMIVDSVVNKIRPKLHFLSLDSMPVWLDEVSRHPTLENMLDEQDDEDFYRRLLTALDAATYNGARALQGVMPYQLMDDEPPGICGPQGWCASGMYRRDAGLSLKPSGSVVKFMFTSWGP
jgi:hypothetical protein